MRAFLKTLDLPEIGKELNDHLTLPITKTEIEKAISRQKKKSPNSDSLPSEWYKTFSEQLHLIIHLTTVTFNHPGRKLL